MTEDGVVEDTLEEVVEEGIVPRLTEEAEDRAK